MDLAVRFNGEIVNADAMQMYKGLPIITNKISPQEQRAVPHHLLDTIPLDEQTWVVGVFKREASAIIKEIRSRGRLPIVVGGTHYYTKALLFKDSLVEAPDTEDSTPPQQPDESASTEFPILEDTTDVMWRKLKEVDPVMADRWHPNDRRKIRRSLEIYLTTGRRASDIYAEQQERKKAAISAAAAAAAAAAAEPGPDALLFWVHTEDQTLKARLNKRVDKMVDTGLMDEIAQMNAYLQQAGEAVDWTRGIWQSIGFKEFQPYLKALDDGVTGDELEQLRQSCLESMKTATRRYAKYQMKWIPKQMMPLLESQGNLDRLYVLDSTDVAAYAENVIVPAAEITRTFLSGEARPAPASISKFAQDVLGAAEASFAEKDTPCRRHCDYCDTTVLTEDSWTKHIRGRAHRRRARQSKRMALIPVEDTESVEAI